MIEHMYDEQVYEFSGVLLQLRRAVDTWSVQRLAAGLRQLAGLRAALDACEARLLHEFDTLQGWKGTGAADAASWLRQQTGTSQREAAVRVRTATALDALPQVVGALADGMITHSHAATLARAAERTSDVAAHQASLVAKAATQSADAFERTVRTWETRRAADGGAGTFERQHARRSATVTTVEDGMTLLQARLDPIAGATVTSALDRIAEELWRADTGRDGARALDLHVRRADALVEMAKRAMTIEPTTGRRPEPTVMVLIDHQTLAGQLTAAGVCQLADGTEIAPATARRLACTAGILPVVLDGKSRPLDLGTAQRYASPAQRLALLVRDRGCVFPGCDRPHWICDAHHLKPFPIGPTDLARLASLCDAHHHLVHEGGWTLEPLADGGWRARSPDGIERVRPPRQRERWPDLPATPVEDDQLELIAG
jgi:hypothetical protein